MNCKLTFGGKIGLLGIVGVISLFVVSVSLCWTGNWEVLEFGELETVVLGGGSWDFGGGTLGFVGGAIGLLGGAILGLTGGDILGLFGGVIEDLSGGSILFFVGGVTIGLFNGLVDLGGVVVGIIGRLFVLPKLFCW